MTTTVNKTTACVGTLYHAFWNVFAMDASDPRQHTMEPWPQDCLFEGTASELLEKVALGNPDVLPADAARMSKALSEEIEPIANARAERQGYKFIVDRFKKGDQRVIRISIECQTTPCERMDSGHKFCQ